MTNRNLLSEKIAQATANQITDYLKSILPKIIEAAHDDGIDECRNLDWQTTNNNLVQQWLSNYGNYREHHDLNYALGAYDNLIANLNSFVDQLDEYDFNLQAYYNLIDYLETHDFRAFDLTAAQASFQTRR